MNSLMRVQAQQAVETGASFLDWMTVECPDIVPAEWVDAVDLTVLDVARPTACVLAQIGQAGRLNLLHYKPVALALGIDPYPVTRDGAAVQYGFQVAGSGALFGRGIVMVEFHELTMAWKRLLIERRQKARDAARLDRMNRMMAARLERPVLLDLAC